MATLLLLLISPAMGSFLALLSDRLVRGEDVITRGSACRACGTRLGLQDLVPIVSFAASAGRCRHCGARVPPWLLYMEILAVGLAVIAALLAQGPQEAWLFAGLLWTLLTLMACDLLWFRLPDLLTGILFALALALAVLAPQPGLTLALALWGAGMGVGVFAALRWGYRALRGREGLGLGDVKLIAGLGALLGPYDLPLMLLIASLTALGVALVGRRGLQATRALPFGAALAAATALLWGLRHLG